MSDWVVVGASPSAPEHIGPAVACCDHPLTITCNGGIELFDDRPPTYYWVHDMYACETYREPAKAAQAQGTRCVTLARSRPALIKRGLDFFDEFVVPDGHFQRFGYRRDVYTDGGYSGQWITQFALHNGATSLSWVGMEGYRTDGKHRHKDVFHEPRYSTPPQSARNTQRLIGPMTQAIVDAWPEVAFRFYGTPTYPICGENLEVIA